ncbi:MAG TPA: cysteine hydrolase [Firmicutes bacterium]|nr:cysteine hydrolase [Bacillota bacterium]
MNFNLDDLLKSSETSIIKMVELLQQSSPIALSSFKSDETALIIVDMINGFVKTGALSSPRIKEIVPTVCELITACQAASIKSVAFADSHPKDCIEFQSYPVHCLTDSDESEIIDEIKEIGHYDLILKNSTNGFLEPAFQKWLKNHPSIHQFIIIGDCTDICVEQFAITLKTYFNAINRQSRVIVPMSCVETYDLLEHVGDLMNLIALYKMHLNGVEVTPHIEQ